MKTRTTEHQENVMQHDGSAVETATSQHLPPQAEPVSRKAAGAAISGDAGLEASDYNDPTYFFLNWPT
jgi:hypothetical protein